LELELGASWRSPTSGHEEGGVADGISGSAGEKGPLISQQIAKGTKNFVLQ
jgi:hypothetical protein